MPLPNGVLALLLVTLRAALAGRVRLLLTGLRLPALVLLFRLLFERCAASSSFEKALKPRRPSFSFSAAR